MTAQTALQRVTQATRRRHDAADQYRAAILDARAAGASYREIARAAGTGAPNVIRIIRRNTKGGHANMTDRYVAHYRDGYYVVLDTATGRVVPPDPGHYKRHRDGYLWDYAAVSEAARLNQKEEG